MGGVQQVTQLSDTTLHWVAEIAGVRREWDAAILEQVPDQKVAWAAPDGATNAGAVRFAPSARTTTMVTLHLEYEPEGMVEKAGDALNIVERQAEADLERFKTFIEGRGIETGAWRGGSTRTSMSGLPASRTLPSRGDSGKAGVSGKAVAAGVAAVAAGAAGVAAASAMGGRGDADAPALDGRDVVDVLTADHREATALIADIWATTDRRARRDMADTVITELVRHSVAEEMYVYPAMREHLPDGEAAVEHDIEEHKELEAR